MKTNELPSQDHLREIFDYNPEDGVLTWRPRNLKGRGYANFNSRRAGKEAFTTISPKGYRRGTLGGKCVFAHRVIYKWWHGIDADEVDHINCDRLDNRIENLRSVSRRENTRNLKKRYDGVRTLPVCVQYIAGRYRAIVRKDGRNVLIGCFDTPDQASDAVSRFTKAHNLI